MGFAPRATIDHAALRNNLKQVRKVAPGSRIWAVIKANAYGHGIERVAQALSQADGYAVARIDEALKLRQTGVNKPLLILEGTFTLEDTLAAVESDCQLTVHSEYQAHLLEQLQTTRAVSVWLKVDTGMHRLGIQAKSIDQVATRLRACSAVGELNLMTHLANADDRTDDTTERQCERFDHLRSDEFKQISIANSAGLMAFPCTRRDWVRPGIMLYGVSPFTNSLAQNEGLQPVMTFSSRVIAVNHCMQGDPVGYGGAYICPEAMPVAVIGVGYGDGYPRHAGHGTPVLLRNRRLPLIGRVSMDMLCVDARDIPDLEIGEPVVLWGEGLPVEEVAAAAGSIGYELLCGVTQRVDFVDLHTEGED